MRLLRDVKKAFRENGRVKAGALLEALHKTPGAPWADLYGKPLTGKTARHVECVLKKARAAS